MTESTSERTRLTWKRRAGFSAIASLGFWLFLEVSLRLLGFSYRTDVESMAFTFPIDEYNTYSEEPFLQRDPRLFWKARPNVLGHNSHGLMGADFTDARPDGVFRIVCLGDSCTHFGPNSYPEQWQDLLSQRPQDKYEVINAGCIGYSSYQGLIRLKDDVLRWSPNLVTVYFGWNDHWLARGYRDSQQTAGLQNANRLSERLQVLRVWQLANFARSRLQTPAAPEVRVSQSEYGENLKEIHRLCSERGIRVWYLTAPHAFDLGIPEYLADSGEVADMSQILQLHERYNDIVRSVAGQLDAVCCDIAAESDTMDKHALFVEDHIHLSDEGRSWVAGRLLKQMQLSGILNDTSFPAATAPVP